VIISPLMLTRGETEEEKKERGTYKGTKIKYATSNQDAI